MDTTMNHPEIDAAAELEQSESQRKPYATPTMKDFGSVAEITRAGFPEYYMGS